MAEVKILDQAHLFRIEITGRLAGDLVSELRDLWQTALVEDPSRRFSVDLSNVTGFDPSGFGLLREMQEHGTYLSARNPFALVLLNEISSPEAALPTLVYRSPEGGKTRKIGPKAAAKPLARAAAVGE